MPKFLVKIERTTVDTATLEVEADSEEEACALVESGPDHDAPDDAPVNVAFAKVEKEWEPEDDSYEIMEVTQADED